MKVNRLSDKEVRKLLGSLWVYRHEGTEDYLKRVEDEIFRARAEEDELRRALVWAEKALDAAREADLLGGEEGSSAQREFEENMAPIRAVLKRKP